jgi:hypothetical protein
MKAELKTITPEWAAEILAEKNIGNRPMSRLHVDALAKEIKRGSWKVNGDTICINDRRLIDGQHRLAAVVKAGMCIQSFVIEGIPCDVFDTKDVGKRRSMGDTLGVRGEKNSTRLASALVLIDRYLSGRADIATRYTNTEIGEILQRHPEARKSIQTGITSKSLMSPSVLDACHYLFSKKDPVLADEFVEKVTRGAGLEDGSPWYLLRERLVKNSLSSAKLDRPHLMALCIKAWNAVRTGERPRNIRWIANGETAEKFPVIE